MDFDSMTFLGYCGHVCVVRLFFLFITVRNEVCGKVMFLHLCVILFTGRFSVQGSLSGRPPPVWLHVGDTHPTGMNSYLRGYSSDSLTMLS